MRTVAVAAALIAAVLGIDASGVRGAETSDLILGQLTLQRKCIRCHDLDRVFRVERTIADWEEVLVAMSRKGESVFTPEDFETLRTLHVARQRALYAEGIFKKRCEKCHELDRGIAARNKSSRQRWRQAINRMRDKDAQWISADEAQILVLWHIQTQEDEMMNR